MLSEIDKYPKFLQVYSNNLSDWVDAHADLSHHLVQMYDGTFAHIVAHFYPYSLPMLLS